MGGERPGSRAADERDELAPSHVGCVPPELVYRMLSHRMAATLMSGPELSELECYLLGRPFPNWGRPARCAPLGGRGPLWVRPRSIGDVRSSVRFARKRTWLGDLWVHALAVLWQIYSRRRSLQIRFRQCRHRCGGSRAKSARMAWRAARRHAAAAERRRRQQSISPGVLA